MSIVQISRAASVDEIVAEMDRRGKVIERLEARLAHIDGIYPGAIDNLLHHQRQLDMDGIEVAVSRQALCEVLAGIDAVLAAAPSPSSEAVGWRPIETAPKDTAVLLDIGETIPDLIDVRVGRFITELEARELGETVSASGGWMIWNASSNWFVIPFDDAFGWMPLPAAPVSDGGEE